MINVKKMAGALSLALLLGSSSLLAEVKSEKEAAALLDKAYDYIGSLSKYAFEAKISNILKDKDGEIVLKRTSDAKVQRAGMFRVDTKGENINRSVYLAEGLFTMSDNKEKYYATVKTGKGIDGTLEQISKKLGIILPLSTLIHSDMSNTIHPKRVQFFGTRVLSGVTCNYIAFKQNNAVVHMWIEDSATPLIHAAKIVSEGVGTTDMILDWDRSPGFSNSTFIFKAPRGASNVSIKPAN